MNHLKNLTERVVCPFDPVHVVERRRFQAHLIKCQRNLPKNHDFVQCQYWHLHYVRRGELNDHLESCEHKLEKEANKKMWETELQPKFFQPKLMYNDVIPSNELESWDNPTAPSFSSEIMLAKANYMTVPQGLSRSKRKEFREKERERLREKEEEEKVCMAKGEKKKHRVEMESIPPPPRKPTENPVKRLAGGRIAAKFSAPKEQIEESSKPSCSAVSSGNTSGIGNDPTIGRGRGILGWSHIIEPERAFRYSPKEFPKL